MDLGSELVPYDGAQGELLETLLLADADQRSNVAGPAVLVGPDDDSQQPRRLAQCLRQTATWGADMAQRGRTSCSR